MGPKYPHTENKPKPFDSDNCNLNTPSFWQAKRENPTKVSWSRTRYCRKGPQGTNWWSRQKEVFGSQRFDCRTILFPYSKKNQFETRRCFILLRQQRNSANLSHNGIALPGTPWRGLFPLHRLLWRKCLRQWCLENFKWVISHNVQMDDS